MQYSGVGIFLGLGTSSLLLIDLYDEYKLDYVQSFMLLSKSAQKPAFKGLAI